MIKESIAKKVGDQDIYFYRFQNKQGLKLTVTNYGATITSMQVPDKQGKLSQVILGFDTIDKYMKGSPYFGSTVGRYANRIGGAKFHLQGKEYKVTENENGNQLHGGVEGFDKKIWDASIEGDKVVMTYVSKDGEEGYPGTLTAQVTFQLTDENALDISYRAETDAETVVNLTNHSYFNLNGAKDTVLDHVLSLQSAYYTPTDKNLVPTGEFASVNNTPMDFNQPKRIGEHIFEDECEAIDLCNGYDTNYILEGKGLRKFATLHDEKSGRFMEAYTDQPGVQLYTAQGLEDGMIGHGGKTYGPFYGVCLETQLFPDSPNNPQFPSATLQKGEVYQHHTKYVFSIK